MPGELYLCLHLRDFATQAAARAHPELRRRAITILSGVPPLEFVFGSNLRARELGLELGMTRVQAESFAGAAILRRDRAQEELAFDELVRCAERFSPRVQAIASPEEFSSGATLILDVANSERLLGEPRRIAEALRNEVRAGYEASIAVSANAYAAVLGARGYAPARAPQVVGARQDGVMILAHGHEAETLAPLPLAVLELEPELAQTFAAWGVATLGQLAAIPLKSLVARIGQQGHRLHLLACGTYDHLLVPEECPPDAVLSENVELEHPVELLEPLLFLISSTLERLTRRAAERALAVASIETRLALNDVERSEHRRIVRPALPERDSHTLLKLIQLDLELHPPRAAIAGFTIRMQPARRQMAQQGLFAPQSPEPGRLEMLLARLRKLAGEGRVGSPELLDTHAPEAFRVALFVASCEEDQRPTSAKDRQISTPVSAKDALAGGPGWGTLSTAAPTVNALAVGPDRVPAPVLRMVRPPTVLRVGMNGGSPGTIVLDGRQVLVETCSGPWRTSGAWWSNNNWCREEWDVTVKDSQQCLRLAFDPGAGCWHLIGIYD
jgi:protein ImuB